MKKHPIQSNIKCVAIQQVHTYDPAFDKHWEFNRSLTTHKRGIENRRKPLPTPLETRLALQARLAIANHERAAWVQANREKIIAAAKAEMKSKLNRA